MAHASTTAAFAEMPAWKTIFAWISAVLLGLLFIVAGVWKLSDHLDAASRMTQALVPGSLSVAAAIGFGIAETWAGLMLLLPRFRRWGALVTGGLLMAFMIYVGWNYQALQGADCSCFPWIKRAVGPAFFWSDAAMLALAGVAGIWAPASRNAKQALVLLGTVAALAAVAYAVTESKQTGTPAPAAITVEGQPYSLQSGKVLLYFYGPECSHCNAAAKRMATHTWTGATVIGLPTRVPQFARYFMDSTNLKAKNSPDHEALKKLFPHGDPPYAVALEHGRMRAGFARFDSEQPEAALRTLGFIE